MPVVQGDTWHFIVPVTTGPYNDPVPMANAEAWFVLHENLTPFKPTLVVRVASVDQETGDKGQLRFTIKNNFTEKVPPGNYFVEIKRAVDLTTSIDVSTVYLSTEPELEVRPGSLLTDLRKLESYD